MNVFENADTTDNTKKGTLTGDAAFGELLRGQLTAGLPAKPDGQLKLFFDTNAMAERSHENYPEQILCLSSAGKWR